MKAIVDTRLILDLLHDRLLRSPRDQIGGQSVVKLVLDLNMLSAMLVEATSMRSADLEQALVREGKCTLIIGQLTGRDSDELRRSIADFFADDDAARAGLVLFLATSDDLSLDEFVDISSEVIVHCRPSAHVLFDACDAPGSQPRFALTLAVFAEFEPLARIDCALSL
jgi:hypothetical protein